MTTANIIGAGKVGRSFIALLRDLPGATVQDICSGHHETARDAANAAGTGRAVADLSEMRAADMWFLTVPDDTIAAVARQLADVRGVRDVFPDHAAPVAIHCSGFLSSEALAPLRAHGWSVASCHPVLSFADPEMAAQQFPGTYCAVEGDAPAVARIRDLVGALGGVPFAVRPERKALYHAGAVFSNNFTVVLQAIAQEAWSAAGVPDDVVRELCAGLMRGTAENVARLGPGAALTGPAARDDRDVLRQQADAVAALHGDAARLYRDMSVLARRLKQSGGTAPDDDLPDDIWGTQP